MAHLDNYPTASTSRVESEKNVPLARFAELRRTAEKSLLSSHSYRAKADLNGVTVEFWGNSKHQHDFWTLNWNRASDSAESEARIFSAFGVDGVKPSAFYCPETNESVFFNTEYYGQCKSWALGMAAAVFEQKYDTHSIHGACVDVEGKGVVIVAPTGTGKTTQAFKLMELPQGKIVGDDWVYVDHGEGETLGHLVGRQPEKSLYMRTETQKDKPWLRETFGKSKCENVTMRKQDCKFTLGESGCKKTGETCVFNQGFDWCFYGFGNSRALVPRGKIFGEGKVADEAMIRLLVLLRRDKTSPAEVRLDGDTAIKVLRKGEYMVQPGAGPEHIWGSMAEEPWYNPYLLRPDHPRQEHFFRRMITKFHVECILLNTGVESIDETHQRIISALKNN